MLDRQLSRPLVMPGQDEHRYGVFICMVVVSYLAATLTSAASLQLWTWDLETFGWGFLVPLFELPAIAGFAIVSVYWKSSLACTIIYGLLCLPSPLFLTVAGLLPPQPSDGSDEWALAFAIPLMVSGCAAYSVLLWQHIVRWRRTQSLE